MNEATRILAAAVFCPKRHEFEYDFKKARKKTGPEGPANSLIGSSEDSAILLLGCLGVNPLNRGFSTLLAFYQPQRVDRSDRKYIPEVATFPQGFRGVASRSVGRG